MKDPVLGIISRLERNDLIAILVGARVDQSCTFGDMIFGDMVFGGNTSDVRIYYDELPQDPVFPAIVVSPVDDSRTFAHNKSKQFQDRIQCTAYTDMASGKGAGARTLSKLIASDLDLVTDTTFPSGLHVISISDEGGHPDSNPEIPLFMYHRDFMVKY
jgi:hypothetical protein